MTPEFTELLLPIATTLVVLGAAVGGWAWYQATSSRRDARRREVERAQRRARAEAWWRQHSMSTQPHSRFFESVLDDPPSLFATSRPPRSR